LLWRCHNKFIIDTITNAAAATDGDDDDDKDGGVYRYWRRKIGTRCSMKECPRPSAVTLPLTSSWRHDDVITKECPKRLRGRLCISSRWWRLEITFCSICSLLF